MSETLRFFHDFAPWLAEPSVQAGLIVAFLFLGLVLLSRRRVAGPRQVPAPPGRQAWDGDGGSVELGSGVSLRFVPIHAGSFRMGSRGYHRDEEPEHEVEIREGFYAAVTPVTQEQFTVWTSSPAYDEWWRTRGQKLGIEERHRNHFSEGGPGLPAERVTWHEAVAYCAWLTPLLPPGCRAFLPTEEQWEFMARARSDTEYANGDGEAALREIGWFDGNSDGRTHSVAQFPPNVWGLHDCHGLVNEWTSTPWDADAYRVPESAAPDEPGLPRVIRGGSWFGTAWICRSVIRYWGVPWVRNAGQGFRVCVSPGPAEAEPLS